MINFRHNPPLDAIVLLDDELVAGSDVLVEDVVLVFVEE